MGMFYIIYRKDVSRGVVGDLYQGSVHKIQGTNENHIGLRPKIYVSILGNVYSKTKDMSSNINSIPLINKWTDKMVKSDIGAVFMTLC